MTVISREGDKWRALSHRAGERVERPGRAVRFSRKLLVSGALFLIAMSVADLLSAAG